MEGNGKANCHRGNEPTLPIAQLFIAAALSAFASVAYSSTAFSGTVSTVGTYGDGSFFFTLSGAAINEPGCTTGQARIDIDVNHAQRKEILSIVLSAKAMEKTLTGVVSGCSNGFPTFSTIGKSSYIYIVD